MVWAPAPNVRGTMTSMETCPSSPNCMPTPRSASCVIAPTMDSVEMKSWRSARISGSVPKSIVVWPSPETV